MSSKNSIVVFDLDHTLLVVNSSFYFGRFLYRCKVFSLCTLFFLIKDYVLHKWFGLSLLVLHQRAFNLVFRGKRMVEISDLVDRFCEEHLEGFYDFAIVSHLKEAQKKNYEVIILSSSPDFLVQAIAKRLGVLQWRGTEYLVDEFNVLTSIGLVNDGSEKARYLNSFMKDKGIAHSQVTVYSDSYLDLPILKMAGRAISVRPDKLLRAISKENGWEVL